LTCNPCIVNSYSITNIAVKNTGGKLCYCTCSLLVEENEGVVDYLLSHRPACKVVPPPNIDTEFDSELTPGYTNYKGSVFNQQVKNSRRVYPHLLNMDGFFFALIEIAPHPSQTTSSSSEQKIPQNVPSKDKKNKKERKPKKEKKKKFSKRFGGK